MQISYGGQIATEQVPLGWDDGHWLNAPAATAQEGGHLIVTAVEGSDFWRTTAYGFVHDNGHALLRPLAVGEAVDVSFILDYDQQFDQAGVLVRASETTWVKAGVEISDGVAQVGAVVTHGASDWSVAPVPSWRGSEVTIRVSRGEDALTIRAHRAGNRGGWCGSLRGQVMLHLRRSVLLRADTVRLAGPVHPVAGGAVRRCTASRVSTFRGTIAIDCTCARTRVGGPTMNREDVEFTSEGVTVRGWLYHPTELPVSHRRRSCWPVGGATSASSSCPTTPRRSPHAGIAALVFDYQNLGVSDGDVRQHLDPWLQIRDYQNALSYLESRDDVDAERLGAWGISYSGGHVLILAAIDPRVRAIVSQIPVIDGYHNMRRVHGTMGYRKLWDLILQDRRNRYADPATRLYIPHATAEPDRDLSTWPFPETYETFKMLKEREAPLYENRSTVESVDLLLNYDVMPFVRRIYDTPTLMIVASGDDLTLWDLEIAAYNALPTADRKLTVLPHTTHMTLYSDRAKLDVAAA